MTTVGLRSGPAAAPDVGRGPLPPAFDTLQGEAAYMGAYDANMRFWPVRYDALEVSNRFGSTHLVASGPEDAPPLLLLHGYAAGLTMWWPNVRDLSRNHRVYAVDVIGQPGKSVPRRPIASRDEYVEWLTSILDALNVEQAYLAGMSYGGWLTLSYAVRAPERVRRIVLLSPAGGFVPLADDFYARTLSLLTSPTRETAAEFMDWAAAEDIPADPAMRERYDRLIDQFYLGILHFRKDYATSATPPGVFSDDELRAMRVPTLLLIGEQEPLYDARAALQRARALLPSLEGELVPRSSHLMSFSRAGVVDFHVRAFLDVDRVAAEWGTKPIDASSPSVV